MCVIDGVCVCVCVCICMHIWHHSGKFHDKFCVLQSCHFHVCLQIQRSPSLGRSRVITHFLFRSARCYGHCLHDNSLLFLRHPGSSDRLGYLDERQQPCDFDAEQSVSNKSSHTHTLHPCTHTRHPCTIFTPH